MDRPAVLATRRIYQNLTKLNDCELVMVDELVQKLVSGIEDHGHLDLTTDKRNFATEIKQELMDACWYARFLASLLDGLKP